MRTLKLTIEYDGTHFNGWQIQHKKSRTIQGTIQQVLAHICNERVTVIGSGRTDSGVHAEGQVAHVKIRSKRSPEEILKALNALLPRDIAILSVEEMPHTFHAQYSVKSKTYRYTILNRPTRCAQLRHLCLHYPHPLDVRAMRAAARFLIGKKDFKSFCVAHTTKAKREVRANTTRTIKCLDIKRRAEYIFIDIEATGFLYKMVRSIVGTLLAVGMHKIPPQGMKDIVRKKDRAAAAKTVPPQGLCLLNVSY